MVGWWKAQELTRFGIMYYIIWPERKVELEVINVSQHAEGNANISLGKCSD